MSSSSNAPRYLLLLSLTLFCLAATLLCCEPARASSPSIDLMGVAWDRLSLSVYILRGPSASSEYIDAVAEAFRVWDVALEAFGRRYGYRYLASFAFTLHVVDQAPTTYDILVNFTLSQPPLGELGRATIYHRDGRVAWVDITLYIHYSAVTLSASDVYNVALHEIGHALGLGHTQSKESENGPEPMYPYYTLGSGKMVPTTLNVYGVAVAHLWAETGYFTRPNYTAVHLPAGVPYRMLLYYKVTVKSPYGKVYGGGWYMEGAEAKIGVEETVVLLGGGRRAVFTRWAGDATSSSPSVTIVVDRDYEIEAEWRLQYYVEIITPFSRPTLTPGWHDAGSILEVGLEEYVVTFRNATRRLFVKWAGKWAGDVESPEKKVVVEVSGPLTLEAVWKTQYYVEVIPGYGSASIESDWYDEGLEIALSINRVLIDYGNSTRLVFRSWLIDGVVHEERSVMLRLSKPYVAKALWTKEYEVYVRLLDRGFSELDGSALLVTNGVELPVRSGSSTWLRKGLWTVGGASYVELPRVSTLSPSPGPIALEAQALDELLEVSGPGVVDVRLDVGRVDVYVKDLLGVPCPLITISLGGLVDATSDLQGFAFSLRLPRGSYVVELGLMNLPLGSVSIDVSGGGVVVVAAPLSIYTGLAIFAALIAASMVAKLRLRS